MEKKIWNQPEMEIQEFVANAYVAQCDDNMWSEEGCVGNVPVDEAGNETDFVWFNSKGYDDVKDGTFTFGEFNAMGESDWNRHECGDSSNNPAKQGLYVMNSWMTQIKNLFATGNYKDEDAIDESLWGYGRHAGNSVGGHVYDEVFYMSHS